jgi:sulfoxide reductase heme-binding subunit YedZ
MFSYFFGSFGNFTGFISLVLYIFTLLPTLVRLFIKPFKKTGWNRFLTKRRREIGVVAWVFGVFHGTYILIERDLNFFELNTIKNYFQGLTLITIFTLLAITSNDFSQKKLKTNWKKLHRLTYLVLIFLPWHILDKMFKTGNNPTIWTYIGLVMLLPVTILSLLRFFKYLKDFVKIKKANK